MKADRNIALEAKARRAARRVGLIARMSRWRLGTVDNHGRFLLLEPETNRIIAGSRFELAADAIIEYCGAR